AAAAAGAFATVRRNRDYRGDRPYLEATLAADPDVPRAHFALAQIDAYDGRLKSAEAQCRAALRLWPQYRKARELCSALESAPGLPVNSYHSPR
ncbi:MAG: hypothetical protein KGM24_09470, partial [Elusimicrobia bacterium]|nr:hypothetical protein [Elusimicrobiota bacterium]